jgi:hypothetical protein
MNNPNSSESTNPSHMSFFENATGFTLNNPTFVDIGSAQYPRSRRTGELPRPAFDSWLEADDYDEGLGRLYDESLPDAIHGSAARQFATVTPPTPQHARIVEALATHFGQPQTSLLPKVVILNGTKSNLAQMCAERLEEYSCATFFVSKQLGSDNPSKLFPTIAYQLASDSSFPSYASLLEAKLRRRPSLLRMSLELQFKELIAEPFHQLLSDRCAIDFDPPRLIMLDGLDEYAESRASQKFLQIILKSARNLPFVWLLFTRSEVDGILDSHSTSADGRTPMVTFFWGDERSHIAFPNGSVCAVVSLQPQHRIAVRFYCIFDRCTLKLVISISIFFLNHEPHKNITAANLLSLQSFSARRLMVPGSFPVHALPRTHKSQ